MKAFLVANLCFDQLTVLSAQDLQVISDLDFEMLIGL